MKREAGGLGEFLLCPQGKAASPRFMGLLRELSPGRTKAKGPQVQRPWSPALLALHAPPPCPLSLQSAPETDRTPEPYPGSLM